MPLIVRYKISRDTIFTAKMPDDSKVQDLLIKVNDKHGHSLKYVYSNKYGISLREDDALADHLPKGENIIFYITDQELFDVKEFEQKEGGEEEEVIYDEEEEEEEESKEESGKQPKKDESTTVGHKSESSSDSNSDSNNSNLNDAVTGKENRHNELLETQILRSIKINFREKDKGKSTNPNEFFIYTTQNYETMTNPKMVEIPVDSSYEKTEKHIRESLEIDPDLQMHIYLSTGAPFSKEYGDEKKKNKLQNFFNEINTNHNIYIVITRPIAQEVLDRQIDEVCNSSDDTMKLLMSPICDSTQFGYSRIACLLGSFFYKGLRSHEFIKSVARCTGFAPLIGCLSAFNNQDPVTGLMVVTITASLFALFSKLLPDLTSPTHVFDRTLECACYIVHFEETYERKKKKDKEKVDKLNVDIIDIDNDPQEGIVRYLKNCGLSGYFYQYSPDINFVNDFSIAYINNVPTITEIEDVFNHYASFKPIPPLSARNYNITCILPYINGQTILYVGSYYEDSLPDCINIIDPFIGHIESIDINTLTDSATNSESKLENLIYSDDVEEITVILLDISGSMRYNFEDGNLGSPTRHDRKTHEAIVGDTDRLSVAVINITTFLDKSFAYKLPHIFGLITFNNDISECQFSPISPDIEKIFDKNFKAKFNTKIWDAIDKAITQLIEANKDNRFPKAKLRIIVFSDGIEQGSEKTKEEVCIRAIKNKVNVDSVVFALDDSCLALTQFCHFTGGISFHSKDANMINALFEKESFLSIKLRPPSHPISPDTVATKFNNKKDYGTYDLDAFNYLYITQSNICRVSTPNYVMSQFRNNLRIDRYKIRLLKEMKTLQLSNDETVKLYIKSNDISTWKVYIKGPEESQYNGYWWLLVIAFDEEYPLRPPIFRFITIPYHINVSEDGRICASFLTSMYKASFSIYDLVKKVQNLLAKPEERYPIQSDKMMTWKDRKDIFTQNVENSLEDAYINEKSCTKNLTILDDNGFKAQENDFESKKDDELLLSISSIRLPSKKNEDISDNSDT